MVSQSTQASVTEQNCLNAAAPGDVLLIEDAVYAATTGSTFEPKLREALGSFKVYVLQPDVEARGMAGKLIDGVTAIDYGGFVDLVAEHPSNQSWL